MQRLYRFLLLIILGISGAANAMQVNLGTNDITIVLEAATKLTNSATEFSNAINTVTPNLSALTNLVTKSTQETIEQTDKSLEQRLATIERILDKAISVIPSEPTLVKWAMRSGTVACTIGSGLLAYGAVNTLAERSSAEDNQKQEFLCKAWAKGIFSALLAGVALYLYTYKWNIHLSMLPPVKLPPVIS